MGVSDGQAISAAITNAAFLNKNQADQMANPVSFTKTLSLSKRNESSAATINALDTSSSLVNVTGTVTTINGATAPATYSDGALLIISNSSAVVVTVSHESASATATNRFSLPGSVELTIGAGQSFQFYYNTTDSRWKVMSTTTQGNQLIGCRYTNSAPTQLTNAYNVKPFPTLDYDTTSSYNTTTGVWTCPTAGYYRAMLRCSTDSSVTFGTTGSITLRIRRNSTDIAQMIRYGNGSAINLGDSVTTTLYCAAGDTVDFVVRTSSTTNMYAGGEMNQIEIIKVG